MNPFQIWRAIQELDGPSIADLGRMLATDRDIMLYLMSGMKARSEADHRAATDAEMLAMWKGLEPAVVTGLKAKKQRSDGGKAKAARRPALKREAEKALREARAENPKARKKTLIWEHAAAKLGISSSALRKRLK